MIMRVSKEHKTMKDTDTTQVGGQHYKEAGPELQHWNLVVAHRWDYFQAQIIKYVMRWKYKGGVQDLQKAKHFLEKYIEVSAGYDEKAKEASDAPGKRYVDQ
jgi:hypothetical protein